MYYDYSGRFNQIKDIIVNTLKSKSCPTEIEGFIFNKKMDLKICTKCKEEKSVLEFHFIKTRNCFAWHCKKCVYSIRPSKAKIYEPTKFENLKGEIWFVIPNTNNIYEASNLSRIRSIDRYVVDKKGRRKYVKGTMLKQHLAESNNGRYYYNVCICIKNKKKTKTVHSLIFSAFNGFCPTKKSGMVVDHKDNNSLNNNIENLQFITNRENNYKDRKGTSKYPGVFFRTDSNKWQSAIGINGKQYKILCSNDELIAKKAYEIALENIHLHNGNNTEFRNLVKQKMAIVE